MGEIVIWANNNNDGYLAYISWNHHSPSYQSEEMEIYLSIYRKQPLEGNLWGEGGRAWKHSRKFLLLWNDNKRCSAKNYQIKSLLKSFFEANIGLCAFTWTQWTYSIVQKSGPRFIHTRKTKKYQHIVTKVGTPKILCL